MARISVNVGSICPALRERGASGPTIWIDTALASHESMMCDTGGGLPEVEVEGDRVVQIMGRLAVSCVGCTLLNTGFAETIRRKIR